ncbi:hypothetical protein [Streptomyces sp. TR02-1]|uniref:hypothetical protein n=1 Tax=Streptomyces sp. TR02-1 TaxID=3385977 RepID=UPI00399FCD94
MALADASVLLTLSASDVREEMERELRAAARSAGRALDEGLRRSIAGTGLAMGRRIASDLRSALRGVAAEIALAADVARFRARLVTQLRALTVEVLLDVDRSPLRNLRDLQVTADVEVDRDGFRRALRGLGSLARSAAGAIGKTLGFSLIAAQAAAATAGLVQFTAALAPAAGALAALPAAAALGAAAVGTLAVALRGVGDAFGAALTGDAQEFSESLEGLAPAAQSVARELRGLKPELAGIQRAAQQALFAPLQGQLTTIAKNLSGPVKSGVRGVAAEFGNAGAAVAEFAAESETADAVTAVFSTLRGQLQNLVPAIQPVLAGFRSITVGVLPAFDRLSAKVAELATSFGQWMQQAGDSGQALRWVEDAFAVFSQLGTILSELGGIFGSVFSAAQASGGNLLSTLGQLLAGVNDFLSSAEGQDALLSIFSALSRVGAQLGPIISALGSALAAVAPQIADIAVALGPGLATAIDALGPALAALGPGLTAIASGLSTAFASLGPALQPLGSALSGILSSLSPLLPVIGELAAVVASALTGALRVLIPILQPVVDALASALLPILPKLASAALQVASALTPLAAALGDGLGQVLSQVLPPILELVPALLQGLMPAFRQLIGALTPLIPPLTQIIVQGFQPLISILPELIPLVVQIVSSVAELVAAASPLISILLQVVAAFQKWGIANVVLPILKGIVAGLGLLVSALTTVVGWVTRAVNLIVAPFQWLYDTLVGHSIIPDLVNGIIDWFAGLPGRLLGVLGSLASQLAGLFGQAMSSVGRAVLAGITAVVGFFLRLPGRAVSAASSIGGRLVGMFTSALSRARGAVSSGITAVVGFFLRLPGRAASAVGGLAGRVSGVIRGAIGAAKRAASALISGVVDLFRGLPGKIASAIGNIGSQVRSSISGGLGKLGSLIGLRKGAVVTGPTPALIGEAGPEVVIPLRDKRRAMQLARESGLMAMISQQTGSAVAAAQQSYAVRSGPTETIGGVHVNAPITVTTYAADPETVAYKVQTRLARLAVS